MSRPVFANSAWVDAPERLVLRGGSWRRRALRVRYGFFNHPVAGPTLIDTGYTEACTSAPGRSGALRLYNGLLRPRLVAQEQCGPFLSALGLEPRDIRTLIVTHFHADHVSGLNVFPNARFIGHGSAYRRVQQAGFFGNVRHGVFGELLPEDFHARLTPLEDSPAQPMPHLPVGHDLFGDGSVLAIPLPGHADGHFGVFFPQLDQPLLYATDTQWLADALPRATRPSTLPRLISDDLAKAHQSNDAVDSFVRSGGRVVLCHDDAPCEFDYSQGARP